MLAILGKLSLGLIMGFGGLGSCLGIRAAGISAAAGWAKEGKEGKPLSGKFSGLVGMPVSQTLYSMILYFLMRPFAGVEANGGVLFGIAVGIGLCELFSAYVQGMIGGAGIRALVDNGGKGFGNIIVAMGIAESVGLFAMVVGILILNSNIMVAAAEVAATTP
jgi:V/A-type H+-transporting ATPase subunit K